MLAGLFAGSVLQQGTCMHPCLVVCHHVQVSCLLAVTLGQYLSLLHACFSTHCCVTHMLVAHYFCNRTDFHKQALLSTCWAGWNQLLHRTQLVDAQLHTCMMHANVTTALQQLPASCAPSLV
jgi:hypothetical protein